MKENNIVITIEDIKKMLAESVLPDEQKKAFSELIDTMTEAEKSELINIIETGAKEKMKFEDQKDNKLATLNNALGTELSKSSSEEDGYIRDEFENFDKQQENNQLQILEEEMNQL